MQDTGSQQHIHFGLIPTLLSGGPWVLHAPHCAVAITAPGVMVWDPLLLMGQDWAGRGPSMAHSIPAASLQHPHSCRGSWGNKPLETPSVSGSGDIVWDPIALHPF